MSKKKPKHPERKVIILKSVYTFAFRDVAFFDGDMHKPGSGYFIQPHDPNLDRVEVGNLVVIERTYSRSYPEIDIWKILIDEETS